MLAPLLSNYSSEAGLYGTLQLKNALTAIYVQKNAPMKRFLWVLGFMRLMRINALNVLVIMTSQVALAFALLSVSK